MSDNPLSDYLDKRIKESATRVTNNERTVNVYLNFSFTDYMKAGCGLALGILMAVFTVAVLKYLKQLLGI